MNNRISFDENGVVFAKKFEKNNFKETNLVADIPLRNSFSDIKKGKNCIRLF